MACGVYFDEALEDNGALRVFPGSHKLGEQNQIQNQIGFIASLENFESKPYWKQYNNSKSLKIRKNSGAWKGDVLFFMHT